MDANDLIPYLGRSDDDPDLKALLTRLGIDKPPKLKKGSAFVNMLASSHGIGLMFEPERPKSSRLVLTILQFYVGSAMQGTSPYEGALPWGLQFSDPRESVIQKLGPPNETEDDDDDLGIELWTVDKLEVTVEFREDPPGIAVFEVGIPIQRM